MKKDRRRDGILLLAFLFSGTAALGFEMVWTRMMTLIMGGEVLSMLGVLSGFFGGMVLGAYFLSTKATNSKDPIKVFIILELIIIIFGAASSYIFMVLSEFIPQRLNPLMGDNSSSITLFLSLIVGTIVILPATFCMGANFAFLIEERRRIYMSDHKSKNTARIYAANTLGATIGIIITIHILMPEFGFRNTCFILSTIGLASIITALLWKRSKSSNPNVQQEKQPMSESNTVIIAILFGTGLCTLGMEIAAVHLLKQIFQNTVYTFANILTVYLIGTALGAWLWQIFVAREKVIDKKYIFYLFILQMMSLVFMMIILTFSEPMFSKINEGVSSYFLYLLNEITISLLVFLVPTILMGAIFSYLIGVLTPQNVGKGYAINVLGAMIAPYIFGLLFIPYLSSYYSLVVIFGGYGLMLWIGIKLLNWNGNYMAILVPIILVLLPVLFLKPDLVRTPEKWKIIDKKEGLMGTVIVSELSSNKGPFQLPLRMLQVNNRYQMGGSATLLERRMGCLPLILQPNIKNALYLGVGTGTTIGMANHIAFESIDAVELVPEVKKSLSYFQQHNQGIFNNPRVIYHTADARRFVKASGKSYDLIVSDLFHPARDGAGFLYTVDHFQNIRSHLTDDGMAIQWLPIHQFDLISLKITIRSYLKVFPETHVFIGSFDTKYAPIALVSKKVKWKFDVDSIKGIIKESHEISEVYQSFDEVKDSYLLGPDSLTSFVGEGSLNTDNHPRVLFETPKYIFKSESENIKINLDSILPYKAKIEDAFTSQNDDSMQMTNTFIKEK